MNPCVFLLVCLFLLVGGGGRASTIGGQVLQWSLGMWRGGVVRLESLFDDRGLYEDPEDSPQPINIPWSPHGPGAGDWLAHTVFRSPLGEGGRGEGRCLCNPSHVWGGKTVNEWALILNPNKSLPPLAQLSVSSSIIPQSLKSHLSQQRYI